MPDDKLADELTAVAAKHGLIVIVQESFTGKIYHILPRAEFYATMLSNWSPVARLH